MNRNLDRRIELLFEVEHPELRTKIRDILKVLMADTLKTRVLQSDGTYKRIDKRGKTSLEAQLFFCEKAREREKFQRRDREQTGSFEPIMSSDDLENSGN
jgi:polyphosphate kinase